MKTINKELSSESRMEALFKSFNPIFEGRSGNWDVDLRNFLEIYLQELHNQNSCSSMINFSQAAIVLQKSVYVYEKKVDYLSQLVMQLLDVVQLSKSGSGARSSKSVQEQSAAVNEAEPSTSKKGQGRKARSIKPYLSEEFSQINCKVSVKSLDLAVVERTSSKPELTLKRSAVFGRMVNIKKKRKHELYVFDKNEECMGKKDDFRLSWSLNHQCVLVEDPFDDSVVNPPPVSARLDDPISCDALKAIPSPASPSSAGCADDCVTGDPTPITDTHKVNPLSPNQEVPNEQVPGQVSNETPNEAVSNEQSPAHIPSENTNQEVPEAQSPAQETGNDNTNQEVPDVEIPNLAGPSESAATQGVVLPDTPPDSQLLSGPGVDVATPRLCVIEEEDEEVAGQRRNLRERNTLKEGNNLYPLNFLFSASLLQTLDDSTNSSLSSPENLRAQARKNGRKGKRRFREVLDEEEGLAGFDEIIDEPPAADAAPVAEHSLSDVPREEAPQLNVPVPTPPPTPSNSQPMSPDPVSRTPMVELPTVGSPIGGLPIEEGPASPSSPDISFPEEPVFFDPYGSTETDRSARVAAWHKSIKERLEEANARPPFDVHVYGSKVITSFPSVGSTLDFKDLVGGMEKAEIARIFLTTLMLANTENVEISLTKTNPLPVDCMALRLLSTQRHEEELEAFCAPSVDHQRRSNTEAPTTSSGLAHRKRKQDVAQSKSVSHKKPRAKSTEYE